MARAVWMVFEWRQQWVVATNKRLMLTYGFIVRKVAMMPLTKVTDMSYHRTIMGRIFGWGTFVMESAGQQQALSEITYLPRADVLYRDVSDLLFGGDGADSGDDEGNPEPSPRTPRRPEPGGETGGRRDTAPVPPLPQDR